MYDAWGNHKVYGSNGVENTSTTFIGNINPFRYRSYYYDRESNLYYCNARYYNPELCRWMSLDSIEYLEEDRINGCNLYAYCGNDPVNYFDESGHSAILAVVIISAAILLLLKSDAFEKKESKISSADIDINGTNSNGSIKVEINDSWIQITNSKDIRKDEDITRVLELIMNSDEYKNYNYDRTLESYKSEWKAHTFAYCIFPFGAWGESTRSVNLNKNIEEDIYRFIYWLF